MASATTTGQGQAGQSGKSIDDVVIYAVSHRTRVQILVVLNQGAYSTSEVADIIGQPLKNIAHHMKELADGGAIEIAKTERRRNFDQHFYRAVELPMYSKEEVLAMHPVERQMMIGFIVQSLIAEVLASLHAGKMSADPAGVQAWDRLNLDEQGRRAVNEEQERHWERLAEIEEESVIRTALSGAKTTPYMVAVLGFERALKAPVARGSANADCAASSG